MRLCIAVWLLAVSPLLAQDPVDARGWINRGVSEFKSEHYPQAVDAFQRAVQADPTFVTARLYLGTAWMQQYIPGAQTPANQGMATAASQEFLKVLDLDPANKTAMSYLASLNLNQKKWDEAQAWYQKLVAVDPSDATAWYSLGFIAWARWYPANMEARKSLGMKLEDPGPLPAGAIKAGLKTTYGPVIEGGLHALQQALLIDPKYGDAMAYMNLLIRERADLVDTAAEYRKEIAVADNWVGKAVEIKKQEVQARGGMGGGMASVAPPPPPPPPQTPGRIRISGNVVEASIIRKVAPVYPPDAKRDRVQGTVTLNVVIDRDGSVIEASLRSGNPVLAQAAIDAVRQWVYRPTILNGEPVAVETQVDVNFQIN